MRKDRGMQEREASQERTAGCVLSMVCEEPVMLHHMRQALLNLYVDFGLDFPMLVITLGITLLKELQKFEKVHRSQELHIRPRLRHLLQLCCCSVLVWSADLAMAGI